MLHETRTLLLLVASLILAVGCNSMNQTTPKVQQSSFGATSDGTAVDLFTLSNRNGMTVKLISYGATIIDVHAPDRNGTFADVTIGYDHIKGYHCLLYTSPSPRDS